MFIDKLVDQLVDHEGMKLKPYKDTKRKTTIGVGRNLQDNGISEDEARMLLRNDIVWVMAALDKIFYGWKFMSEDRQLVVADMMFNMGAPTFKKFRKFWKALKSDDYHVAADEMLNSKWAKQVKGRATKLAAMMRG